MALSDKAALRGMVWQPCAVTVAVLLVSGAGTAYAFQVDTSATSGCHEKITAQAIARAGWPDGAEPPAPDDDDRAALDDLPFSVPDDMRDAWTLALLIGARHNDVGSSDPFDFAALTELHNDPDRQMQHCLRREGDDFEEGDAQALAACKAYILEEVAAAVGDGDEVDLERTETVETRLVFRGRIELELQRYGFHMGMAVHALEDSYAHIFRRADDERVRHVLNWIEGNVGESYDVARDGHEHMSPLDECSGGAGARRRKGRALAAAAELLAAVADGEGGREGRLARAAAVIDSHMVREPGCVADNDWCDAAELRLAAATCSVAGRAGGLVGVLVLVLVMVLGRRRSLVLAVLLVTRVAVADEPTAEEKQEEKVEAKKEQKLDVEEKVIERLPDPVTQRWGAAVQASGSFDRGAAAVAAGLRWTPNDCIGFGLDAEYNPWFSISAGRAAPGVASLYIPIIWKLKRFGTWELRSTFYAGATMLMFDLVGADKGQIGPYVGWNPLGLALPLGTHTKLVIKPGDIAVPIPQVTGIPFYYHQYRTTIGLEWYP